ncbi:hypothetical protein D3C81_2231220 [compost metagenome]
MLNASDSEAEATFDRARPPAMSRPRVKEEVESLNMVILRSLSELSAWIGVANRQA